MSLLSWLIQLPERKQAAASRLISGGNQRRRWGGGGRSLKVTLHNQPARHVWWLRDADEVIPLIFWTRAPQNRTYGLRGALTSSWGPAMRFLSKMTMSRKKAIWKQTQGESFFPEYTDSARVLDFIFLRNFSFYSDSWDSLKVIFRLLQFKEAPSFFFLSKNKIQVQEEAHDRG